jgi:hypothetical protein
MAAGPDERVRRTRHDKTTHGRPFIVDQLLQILGAVLVLAAYAVAQFRLLPARSFAYGFLNLAGSAILALLALDSRQWGFLLLEGTWALISLWAVFAPPGPLQNTLRDDTRR